MYPALHFIVPSLCIFFKLSHSHPILGRFYFLLSYQMTLLKLIIRRHLGSAGLENTRFLYFHFFPFASSFYFLIPLFLLHFYLFFLSSLLPLFLVCLKRSPEIGPRIKEIWNFSSTNFLADLEQVTSLCTLSPHLEKKRLSLWSLKLLPAQTA